MVNKVAIVCNSINPDLVIYFRNIVELIGEMEERNNSFIFLKNKSIQLSNRVISYNSSVSSNSFFDFKALIDLLITIRVFIILLKSKVTIIHFTTAHVSNVLLSLLAKIFRIKLIFTIHDIIPHPNSKTIFIRLYNNLIINYLADEVITFNEKQTKKVIPTKKTNIMKLAGFEKNWTMDNNGSKILFFGRIEAYKGLNFLLDVIKTYNKQNFKATEFIIAGKGYDPNLEELKSIKNVRIINRFIADHELQNLYHEIAIVILPYRSATQSGVIIQSYSHGKPVICFDVGGLSEYVENNKTGFLIKPFDCLAMAKKINQYLSDFEIKKIQENVKETFEKNYSKEANKKQLLNFYRNKLGCV